MEVPEPWRSLNHGAPQIVEAPEPWRSPSRRGRGQGGAAGLATVPSPGSRRKGDRSLLFPSAGGGCGASLRGSAPLPRPRVGGRPQPALAWCRLRRLVRPRCASLGGIWGIFCL